MSTFIVSGTTNTESPTNSTTSGKSSFSVAYTPDLNYDLNTITASNLRDNEKAALALKISTRGDLDAYIKKDIDKKLLRIANNSKLLLNVNNAMLLSDPNSTVYKTAEEISNYDELYNSALADATANNENAYFFIAASQIPNYSALYISQYNTVYLPFLQNLFSIIDSTGTEGSLSMLENLSATLASSNYDYKKLLFSSDSTPNTTFLSTEIGTAKALTVWTELSSDTTPAATTIAGLNILSMANPDKISYLKINADNTVNAVSISELKEDLDISTDNIVDGGVLF